MKNQFNQVLKELVIRHREYFETQMAFTLIQDNGCIDSVKKISSQLIDIFQQYPAEINDIILNQPKVLTDLYSQDLYGHLTRAADVSPYHQMILALKNASINPIEALHVHMVFIHRIYDHLSLAKINAAQKQHWVEKIFNANLFYDRSRKEISSVTQSSYKNGICQAKFFNKKIDRASTHKPAKEKYKVDENSNFYKEALALSLPTVCGPSGHTGSLVLLAGILNSLNQDEWQDYALIVASFLVIAGCHSLHESMMVSKIAGVAYEYGSYHSMFSRKNNVFPVVELIARNEHIVKNS
jgi:hypothetical protein